jgi:hypothetical protein
MKLWKLVIILLGIAVPGLANAVTLHFDTSTATDWKATGGGAYDVTPYSVYDSVFVPGNKIAVTSNQIDTGTFMPGGSLANFTGFWTGSYLFYLPGNATDVQFQYSKYYTDDRSVMTLNGAIIDSTGLPVNGLYAGSMVFTEGGALQPYTFHGPNDGTLSGTVSSGFNLGGMNTVTVIVNNTGQGVVGGLTSLAWNDGSDFSLEGTITYVPEPSFAVLSLLGLSLIFRLRPAFCESKRGN